MKIYIVEKYDFDSYENRTPVYLDKTVVFSSRKKA